MPRVDLPELIIILVIVILLFGIGRISKIAGEMGKSIKSFRDGLKGDDSGDGVQPEKQEPPEK
ncbi:MAG TPA: twin-arginine translocase TatA/TatE family subunit [Anaerolineaceae bacterium]|nr:twin-arginine translocase TatA/TatE family subunit [Chloroflexota bacterium]HPA32551.1 twin-arginine translocase TatA/TatE family subunit [Anaerolineaceae bacterium]HQO96610.1 twin-arginine translocase TatA/TatE family subunit [Anaerolineaceae bacterium]HQP59758.1 twin-arginine translocase TatA/TatE family subunit [Anaerolineaceae bacterium]